MKGLYFGSELIVQITEDFNEKRAMSGRGCSRRGCGSGRGRFQLKGKFHSNKSQLTKYMEDTQRLHRLYWIIQKKYLIMK